MAEHIESVEFDDLEHADDWVDATTREEELQPTEEALTYLATLEKELTERYYSEEVQKYVKEQEDARRLDKGDADLDIQI
jgi:hypothetical protein